MSLKLLNTCPGTRRLHLKELLQQPDFADSAQLTVHLLWHYPAHSPKQKSSIKLKYRKNCSRTKDNQIPKREI